MSATGHTSNEDRARRIAELNDAFRTTFSIEYGMVVDTPMVRAAPYRDELLRRIQTFDTFNEGNNPHGENDFGSIDMEGEKYFWKIDYYDKDLRYGSDDPADLAKTKRVLTVMHASEY